jgi:hypothetical protein
MPTNNLVNIPTGTSSKVVQSQGAGIALALTTATYPSTATGTGKILREDGTNWTPTTSTYPDTAGTSTNVLTSDGTNWISSSGASTSGIITITGSLTNSQIKSLHATPIQIIAAPGSGSVIRIITAVGKMVYGGTNAFTAAASQTINLYFGAGTTSLWVVPLLTNAMIVATATQIASITPTGLAASTTVNSTLDNQPVYLYNPVATEISGNAANNNTVNWSLSYQVITI